MDHIDVVNQVIENSAEYTKPLYMSFVDYKKAFDFVLTAALPDALKHQGIKETFIRLLDDIRKEFTGRITLHKQSHKVPIPKGVTK